MVKTSELLSSGHTAPSEGTGVMNLDRGAPEPALSSVTRGAKCLHTRC